ncbi:hypothetical protein R4P53_25830, partial [Rhodococcus sp. IEGM 1414]
SILPTKLSSACRTKDRINRYSDSPTTANDPVGIAGDMDPVLNMMRVMLKAKAQMTRAMQTTPPTAKMFKSQSPALDHTEGFASAVPCRARVMVSFL